MMNCMKKQDQYNEYEKKVYELFEVCGVVCKSLGNECFMYRYKDGVCSIFNLFQFGKFLKKGVDKDWIMSGWDVEKIKKWVVD